MKKVKYRYKPMIINTQQGVGMIEILISVFIMGIGVLGIAAMQSTALKNVQFSMGGSMAVVESYAMFDAMRANNQAALSGEYNVAKSCETSEVVGSLAQKDIGNWIASLQAVLGGNACGEIACTKIDSFIARCTATVYWESNMDAEGDDSKEYNITVATQL